MIKEYVKKVDLFPHLAFSLNCVLDL
jgi:hypothetical protein